MLLQSSLAEVIVRHSSEVWSNVKVTGCPKGSPE